MVIPETRYCACEKCDTCERDRTKGLCEYVMDPKSNMLCGDCEVQTCNSEGRKRYDIEEQQRINAGIRDAALRV